MVVEDAPPSVELSVSDPAELRSLREHLRRIAGLRVDQVTGTPNDHEQGVGDLLVILASGSSVLGVAIRTIPVFIRSRRASLTVTVKAKDTTITVTADNIEDVAPVLKKALDV